MNNDFEREMLTNAHVQAAVEVGRRAAFTLLKRGGAWEVDDESDEAAYQMAQHISAAVVEAVRSSVVREVAHLIDNQLHDIIDSEPLYKTVNWLNDKADEMRSDHERRL